MFFDLRCFLAPVDLSSNDSDNFLSDGAPNAWGVWFCKISAVIYDVSMTLDCGMKYAE